MWNQKWGDEYPSGEGPEERMHREQLAQHEKDCNAVDRLLRSLRPEHATRRLIPWTMIKKWKLPHRHYPLD